MNENQVKQNNLLDTTDCLEAVGVFRGWKNFLFIIIICCLLLLQALFWVVNVELVKIDNETGVPTKTESSAVVGKDIKLPEKVETITIKLADDANTIERAAKQVAADSNVPAAAAPKKINFLSAITFKHLAWLIRFLDFVLIPTAILYCLTMLFCLKVSLLGRLGGINHISRAFFLSLFFLVLLLPWQRFFGPVIKGAIYTPDELTTWLRWYGAKGRGIFAATLLYLRFTGYWLLVMLLLVFSLLRSVRWTKATLHRLEII
jgi:hypothetical protein